MGKLENCHQCGELALLDVFETCLKCGRRRQELFSKAQPLAIKNPDLTYQEIANSIGAEEEEVLALVRGGFLRCAVTKWKCQGCGKKNKNCWLCSQCGREADENQVTPKQREFLNGSLMALPRPSDRSVRVRERTNSNYPKRQKLGT